MAIAFGSVGTGASGTTSLSLTSPATIAAGDLLLCAVANKYPTNGPSAPTGYTLLGQGTGGSGASGIDSGNVYITVYYKVADGTEDGSAVSVTITSGNSARGMILLYTKAAGKDWGLAITNGASGTPGTAWAATGAANPGITTGDFVVCLSAANSDVAAYGTHSILATSAVMAGANERNDAATGNGDDCAFFAADASCTSGTAIAAPTYTAIATASVANGPCGSTAFVRLREIDPTGVGTAAGTSTVTGVGSAKFTGVGSAAGTSVVTGVGSFTSTANGIPASGLPAILGTRTLAPQSLLRRRR